MLLIKLLAVLMLIFVLISLGTAFYHMMKGTPGKSTVKALTFRIGLSIVLVAILGIAVATGVIEPNKSPLQLPVKAESQQ